MTDNQLSKVIRKDMNKQIEYLHRLMHNEIPLTRYIGIEPISFDGRSLTLSAPLTNNLNHKNTAFGGSLYSVCVLSGWGLLQLAMKQSGYNGQVVIQQSDTRFIRPVDQDIKATCGFESESQFDRFLKMYNRKGVSRIRLKSRVYCGSEDSVIFEGDYVVQK